MLRRILVKSSKDIYHINGYTSIRKFSQQQSSTQTATNVRSKGRFLETMDDFLGVVEKRKVGIGLVSSIGAGFWAAGSLALMLVYVFSLK